MGGLPPPNYGADVPREEATFIGASQELAPAASTAAATILEEETEEREESITYSSSSSDDSSSDEEVEEAQLPKEIIPPLPLGPAASRFTALAGPTEEDMRMGPPSPPIEAFVIAEEEEEEEQTQIVANAEMEGRAADSRRSRGTAQETATAPSAYSLGVGKPKVRSTSSKERYLGERNEDASPAVSLVHSTSLSPSPRSRSMQTPLKDFDVVDTPLSHGSSSSSSSYNDEELKAALEDGGVQVISDAALEVSPPFSLRFFISLSICLSTT